MLKNLLVDEFVPAPMHIFTYLSFPWQFLRSLAMINMLSNASVPGRSNGFSTHWPFSKDFPCSHPIDFRLYLLVDVVMKAQTWRYNEKGTGALGTSESLPVLPLPDDGWKLLLHYIPVWFFSLKLDENWWNKGDGTRDN